MGPGNPYNVGWRSVVIMLIRKFGNCLYVLACIYIALTLKDYRHNHNVVTTIHIVVMV